jgi:hypothetical protein
MVRLFKGKAGETSVVGRGKGRQEKRGECGGKGRGEESGGKGERKVEYFGLSKQGKVEGRALCQKETNFFSFKGTKKRPLTTFWTKTCPLSWQVLTGS